jgi:hypothetical protein
VNGFYDFRFALRVSAPNIYRDSAVTDGYKPCFEWLQICEAVIEKFSFLWCGRSGVRLRTHGSFQLKRTSHPGRFTRGELPLRKNFPRNSMTYQNVFEGRLPVPIKRCELGVVAYAGLHALLQHTRIPAGRSSYLLAQL